MEEAARPAGPDDLPRLVELAEAAIEEQRVLRGGAVWANREARPAPVEATLTAAMSDPEQLVLAGTIDDVIVGYVAVRLDTLHDGARLGVVDDIFVEPPARGVGVGEAMLDEVLAWCTTKGCVGVDALALPGNRATKNFFESFGLVARAIVVHRSLTSDDEVVE